MPSARRLAARSSETRLASTPFIVASFNLVAKLASVGSIALVNWFARPLTD
ncbi:hypothetical protein D3C76_1710640 [compost metagenome]